MPDLRDNSPKTATPLKLNAFNQTVKDAVGGRDRHDYYSFKLRQRSSLSLTLTGLQANADLEVLSDRQGSGRLAISQQLGKRKESIDLNLDPGTYHIRVFPASRADKTRYRLSATSDSLGQFQAKYYGNTTLSGRPTLSEYVGDGSLQFAKDWSAGAPTPTADGFSARFTTERSLSPGLYQVKVRSNDGVRVKVGKQTVVDQWMDQPNLPHSGYFYADGKKTLPIAVEYYDKAGQSSPNLSFEIVSVTPFQDAVDPATHWQATLFAWDDSQSDRPDLNFADKGLGNQKAIGVINLGSNLRGDGKAGIQFDWGTDTYVSDGYRLPHDTFALQATTTAEFDGSAYTFRVKGDDGFQLLAQSKTGGKTYRITPAKQWAQGDTYQDITYKLPSGQYDLTFNYFEKRNLANFDLSWTKVPQTSPSNPPKPIPSSLWDSPLHGYPITSPYGQRTYQNGNKTVSGFHRGIDLGTGDERPPIEAARTGVVTYVGTGWNGGYGNLVEIDHGNGLETRYAHLSSISVKEGDRVDTDTVIGYVGMTGQATGNHLHFELRLNGEDKNPEQFLNFA